jgi:hypothetical protein
VADTVDEGKLQMSREWVRLTQTLGVRTPRKLAEVAALSRTIRTTPRGKRRKGG